MPEQTFEVGDQIYFPQTKHFGTIVRVSFQKPLFQLDVPNVRSYSIELDDGARLHHVYRGMEAALPATTAK